MKKKNLNREPKFMNHVKTLSIVFDKMPNSIIGVYKKNIIDVNGIMRSQVSYSYLVFLLQYLNKHGMVTRKKRGQETVYALTEKGKEFHGYIKKFMEAFEGE